VEKSGSTTASLTSSDSVGAEKTHKGSPESASSGSPVSTPMLTYKPADPTEFNFSKAQRIEWIASLSIPWFQEGNLRQTGFSDGEQPAQCEHGILINARYIPLRLADVQQFTSVFV
jgi:hypothetical protein